MSAQANSLRIPLLLLVAFGAGIGSGPFLLNRTDPNPSSAKPTHETKLQSSIVSAVPRTPERESKDQTESDLIQILEDPNRVSREASLEKWGREQFLNKADWQKQLSSISDRLDKLSFLKGVIAEWAKSDPLSALNYLANASLGTRLELVPVAISEWAKRDPAAAKQWILSSTAGEVRTQATEALYRSWALTAPEIAAQNSLTFDDVTVRERALVGVLQEWSANDLKAVEKWASALEQGPIRSTALRAVAEEMARRNPLEAIRWANAELSSSAVDSETIISTIASIAGMEEPSAIMDWLVKLPETPDSASAIAGVSSYWTESDPQFSEQGYLQLPPHARKIAASSIASTLGATDPRRGQQWLQKQSPELQNTLTEDLARAWNDVDPQAAQQWANSLPPSPRRESALKGISNSMMPH